MRTRKTRRGSKAAARTHKVKKFSTRRHSLTIYKPTFYIYDEVRSFVDEDIYDNGGIELTYQVNGGDTVSTVIPLYSVWVDDSGARSGHGDKTIKAYGIMPQEETPETKGLSDLLQMIYENSSVEVGYGGNWGVSMKFMADRDGTTLLYTNNETDGQYRSRNEDGVSVPYFDTKAQAVEKVIKVLGRFYTGKIAGLDFANLNMVSDDLMTELRFVEIKDRLGHSRSMWAGDPEHILTGRSRYNSWGGYAYNKPGDDDVEVTDSQLAESFVDILERELGWAGNVGSANGGGQSGKEVDDVA